MDRTRRSAALVVLALTAGPVLPGAAQASPAAGEAGVEQVVARVVVDGVVSLESFPVDEHGSLAAARRAALATPGVREVAVPVPTRAAAYVDGWPRASQWHVDHLRTETLPRSVTAASGMLVAVLDTGVQADHEDWAAGTVRCELGADFSDPVRPTTSVGDACTDLHGHGTHVAGLVAAARDNGRGVAGLSEARILPVKVLGDDGAGTDASAASGIYHAVRSGADVISLSLGGDSPGAHYDDAVAYAKRHDVPVVASAGNNRQRGNTPSYPAALPDVISVAATGRDDRSTSFSYAGPSNDVAAPGSEIVSLGRSSRSSYVRYDGTSQAAPLVSAVVAMWLAQHPGATVAQVTAALVGTARDVETTGPDPQTGAGLVDPVRLLTGTSSTPPVTPAPPPGTTPVTGPPPATSPPGTPPPAAVTPPVGSVPVPAPAAPRPVEAPGVAPATPRIGLPSGAVRRHARLEVSAGRLAPRSVLTVTARYGVVVAPRVRGGAPRTVVRSVVLGRVRTDATGAAVLRVTAPPTSGRVRLVATGTGPGGAAVTTQSLLTVR